MMKRLLYIFILGGCSLFLNTSCKKESLTTYNASDNIYFSYIINADPATFYLGLNTDSLDVTFSFSSNSLQDTLIGIPVSVTGVASDHDRVFSLAVDPGSTAVVNTNYVLPSSFVLRAGKIRDSAFIKFKRTADLKTKSVSLILLLKDNDQFKTQIEYVSRSPQNLSSIYIESMDTVKVKRFKINVADMLSAGPYWNSDFSYYFGTFSEKKVRLMNQIAGMPLNFWSTKPTSAQQKSDMTYYGGFIFRYLADQAFAGNRIFESDGVTAMKMGSYYQ